MRPLKLTIRTRLSLLLAFSTVLILVGLSAFIYLFTLNYRRNEFRFRLKERLAEADSLLRKNSAYPFITLEHLPPGTLPQEAFFYRKPATMVTVPEQGKVVTLAPLADVEKEQYYFLERGERSYLIHFDKALGNVIVLSAVDVFGYTKMQNLKRVLLAGIALGTIAMGLISWWLPRRELRPLTEKIRRARTIGGQSLNLRLRVRNEHDELGQLAITFNQMLDRIEKAFDVQRSFTSNAAHELRNPITAISGEAQLALAHHRDAETYRAALQRIKDKSDELSALVERLLILAKMEAPSWEKKLIRADEVLVDAVMQVQTRRPQQAALVHLQLQEADSDAYEMRGDAVILQVAFDNVVENALKYGEGKPVQVLLSANKSGIQLNICDEGMGVAPEEAAKLFQLFYRTNAVRHIQGIGIGLALVKRIVEWHGGEIVLQPNQPRGTRVLMTFPKASPQQPI